MREFNDKLLQILKTEIPIERILRANAAEREKYIKAYEQHSGDSSVFLPLENLVTISRNMRYVTQPACHNFLVELHYVVSGSANVYFSNQKITIRQGDILLPNQYASYSMDALGDDDIILTFIMKPQFFEDTYARLKAKNVLSDFIIDLVRNSVLDDRYLHFSNHDNLPVFNIIEILAFTAFPELTNENILRGENPDPEITNFLMGTIFVALSHDLSTLSDNSQINSTEMLRQTVNRYIEEKYKTASLHELAHLLGRSDTTLSRQIKHLFSMTFKALLLQKRFARAMFLLKNTDLSIYEVAEAVGYDNTSFFYRRFRSIYGNSPKIFRK